MVRKKTKATVKKESAPREQRVRIQIWGLVYLSVAILTFVALFSHYYSLDSGVMDNVLGPYIGTYLSLGLGALFAPFPAVFVPVAIGVVGWNMLFQKPIPVRYVFLTTLFILLLSTIAFIPRMPAMVGDEVYQLGGENLMGYFITRVTLLPLFGDKIFGAYFIVFLLLIITIMSFFQLDIVLFMRRIYGWVRSRLAVQKKKGAKNRPRDFIRNIISRIRSLLRPKKTVTRHDTQEAIDIVQFEPPHENETRTDAPATAPSEDLIVSPEKDEQNHAGNVPGSHSDGTPQEEYEPSQAEQFTTSSREHAQYVIPSGTVIPNPPRKDNSIDRIALEEKGRVLIQTLEEFNVKGCTIASIRPGPVVSRFEINPAHGVPIRKILKLQDDLALKVGGRSIRIQAPIPGKSLVGIEIPNDTREIVYFKEILDSRDFKNSSAALPVIIGKSISGQPLIEDISKMPHLLIAGQTGAGKSVGINSFIASLLLSRTPDELRLILIDPKKVEMACYEGIPHLMSPVVTEPEKAVAALQWGVREMESRYKLLSRVGSKNITSFNQKFDSGRLSSYVERGVIEAEDAEKLPYIVIIVDELADLMMTASKDVEKLVQRIAQLARAVGIHLIVATQRPSVDIITGPIKANLTSRISFRTIQSQDSRTILGSVGAEKLLGMGDMLYLKNGAPAIERYHGAFISEEDVENLVAEIAAQGIQPGTVEFDEEEDTAATGIVDNADDLFEDAARLVVSNGLGSTSMIQRRLEVGYARAGRIMDQLEKAGIVGKPKGSKPRELLVTDMEVLDEMFNA
ncbi:FtsK/SpoIIIE family DNA translocase [Chitinivibrio alkaliphilus]|uniref:Cell division protein FtsK/SpoIIIE n=1 Tax=Chitinivibrio alkaliphilus ACht1 TaxID=1313304 RepID=U7DD93_9BACT|nr:DNA translocase FtsK [Chitinivibrio alkaliphilus]ERP38851.1 cell division protein FtsK/SpoIIIE [Chitinivibrio alkaliphilus ACht1]